MDCPWALAAVTEKEFAAVTKAANKDEENEFSEENLFLEAALEILTQHRENCANDSGDCLSCRINPPSVAEIDEVSKI